MFTFSTASSRHKSKPAEKKANKPGSSAAKDQLFTSVALQQHMLRQMVAEDRAPKELNPPRPLPEGELSLAQKMNLVPLPPQAPAKSEWKKIEQTAAERRELDKNCSICCCKFSAIDETTRPTTTSSNQEEDDENEHSSSSEGIKNKKKQMLEAIMKKTGNVKMNTTNSAAAQKKRKEEEEEEDRKRKGNYCVILNCGHLFHHSCLESLERYAKQVKQARRCPLCRSENYFKRPNRLAPALLQSQAIVKIQSRYRGHLARRLYVKLRCKKDPAFKEQYYYSRLKHMNDIRLAHAAAHEAEVEETIDSMDWTMSYCRALQFTEQDWLLAANKALERENTVCAVCYCDCNGDDDDDDEKTNEHIVLPKRIESKNQLGEIIEAEDLSSHKPSSSVSSSSVMNDRRIVVTSCSHLFHYSCAASFHRFSVSDKVKCVSCRDGFKMRFLLKK